MAENRDIVNLCVENNSVGDFLDRKEIFSPITRKKLEVIQFAIKSHVEESKECDISEPTPTLNKIDIKVSTVADLQENSISKKVQQILDEAPFTIAYSAYFQSLQQWLGHVTEIDKENKVFSAKLQDINNPGTYEIAEFEIRDIPEGDLDLFTIGAAFYWSLGYNYNGSQKTKESSIRFQRLNEWTEEEYDNAIDRANDLYQFFTK